MSAVRSGHATRVADGAHVLELAAAADAGPARAENQDAWALLPLDPRPGCALLLADGMGGHADGGVAAYLAVHGAGNLLRSSAEPHRVLADAVGEANDAIARHRATRGGVMAGTTLVAAVVSGGRVSIGSVGDSRAYLVRGGSLLQVTVDHSWVAEQVRSGHLLPHAVAGHPHRSLLTRALTGDPVEVDVFTSELVSGDLLALCSDGLWQPLGDARLAELLLSVGHSAALGTVTAAACDAAIAAGGADNVSLLLCRVAAT